MRRASVASQRGSAAASDDKKKSDLSLDKDEETKDDSNGRWKAKQQGRKRRKRRRKTTMTLVSCGMTAVLFGIILLFGTAVVKMMIRWTTTKQASSSSQNNEIVFQRYTKQAPECNAITPDEVSFTLVTQLSMDRFWMMEHHCRRWNTTISPMSVAILVDQPQKDENDDDKHGIITKDALLKQLQTMGCDISHVSLQLVSAQQYPHDDYPVNVLRNRALAQVTKTTHVMYVDIDFWESQHLQDLLLHQPDLRAALAEDAKLALVVPAFQLQRQCREYRDCREINIPHMPYTISELLDLIKHRQAAPFDYTNTGGHGSTLYQEWFRQEPDELLDIPCIKSNRYEPYLAFRYCKDLPPFQEAFSGYGKNKMTMVMHMRRSGYKFSQLKAFVVHYPHLDSESRMLWNEGPQELLLRPQKRDSSDNNNSNNNRWIRKRPAQVRGMNWTRYKRGRVDAVFVQFREWLQKNVPDEARVPLCEEVEDDDSKLWIERRSQEQETVEEEET